MKKGFLFVSLLLLIAQIYGQTATSVQVIDKRNDNEPPTYYNNQVVFEFKRRTTIGVPGSGTYSGLMTIAPWRDDSGDAHHQLNFNESGIYYRTGQPSGTTWDSWSQILTSKSDIETSGLLKLTGFGNHYISNGNIGIGTTNPLEKLHILGSVRGNQSGALRISSGNGYIDIGPRNTSWAHIYTDRPKFIFNRDIYSVNGGFSAYANSNLYLKTNGTTRLTILKANGNVGIGTTTPGIYKLAVEGEIGAREVNVTLDSWSDFVFDKDYELRSLQELETYISLNKHLPDIPVESEIRNKGVNLGEMNSKLLQKIEELTLYIIEQDKRLQSIEKEIENLKSTNK